MGYFRVGLGSGMAVVGAVLDGIWDAFYNGLGADLGPPR